MLCFPCVWLCFICVSFKITHINIGFVHLYFEFTLLSNTWWTQKGFKSADREHKNILNIRKHQFVGHISYNEKNSNCTWKHSNIKLSLQWFGFNFLKSSMTTIYFWIYKLTIDHQLIVKLVHYVQKNSIKLHLSVWWMAIEIGFE